MPNSIQSQFEFTAHQNHFLFSDHYLNDLLKRGADWRNIADEARTFRSWLRELYDKEKGQLADYSETQLEEHWFKPILDKLGHVYEGQAVVPGLKAEIKKPDFVLFPDEGVRQTAVSAQNTAAYAQNALGIVEVKKWNIHLSKKARGGGPGFANNNPMYQIDYYLRATDRDWGIVSNGKQWRLIHKESSYKLDIYFQLDLEAALHQPDDNPTATATFAFFLLFFRQAALRPDATGRHFLNQTLQSSKTYAHILETDLAENAYKALEHLITGFFAPNRNQLDPANPHHLRQVYDNSLYLLYRILFLLYGESRGLLPMGNDQYRERSLRTLTKAIARIDDNGKMGAVPPVTTQYWDALQRLFAIINGTDPQINQVLGVPRYNGGLFNPQQHPFLENHYVGDQHLARAIDYLARRISDENIKEFVDYRTLGVRQLGSIYEGLLEYQPQMATEPMIAIRQKGADKWLPAAQKKRTKVLERRDVGELYLATDKGERKATGSYYTPDYIVKYIVENTLTPLVEAAQTATERANSNGERAQQFTNAILALNVLDPAMGSGHFLVEATDFLAAALATNEWTQTPDQPPTATNGDEADLVYWRRRVVEASIYGVDKNQLAVELAKLSLWLVTAVADRPLSFLDHHLRHGDSLIGARLDDLHRLPQKKRSQKRKTTGVKASADTEQPSLFSPSALEQTMFKAVGGFMQIETLLSDDIEAVHLKEQIFEQLQNTHLARWRRLADLWTSSFFGNAMSPEEYADLSRRILGTGSSSLSDKQAARYLTHPAMTNNDYFHWELAFPEVFFDLQGNPLHDAAGFDAVIGNPPWVNIGRESGNERTVDFYKISFTSAEYQVDLYSLFLETSVNLGRINAHIGMIVPDPWLANFRTPKLRNFLLVKNQLLQILHTPRSAFPDVGAEHLILILQHTNRKNGAFLKGHITPDGEVVVSESFPFHLIKQKDDFIVYSSSRMATIIEKIEGSTIPLGDEFETIRGVGPYHHRKQPKEIIAARAYHADHQEDQTFIPEMKGEHLARYGIHWSGDSWLSYGNWLAEPREKRFFAGKRLLLREIIGERFSTSVLDDDFIVDRGIYIALQGQSSIDISFVLALLASKLLVFWFREKFSEKDELFPKLRVAHFNMLPIKKINLTTDANERTAVYTTAKTHYEQGNAAAVLDWTAAELAANRNDTIHDLLAHLAEQMIAMHKEKQALTQRFFTDLEGMMDNPKQFATLRDKGKQAATLHKNVPAARPFVNASSRRSLPLSASLDWNEEAFKGFVKLLLGKVRRLSDLVTVYQDVAPAYRTLTQRIASTDELIDQIVYKLYGLTDEEIGIVEGK